MTDLIIAAIQCNPTVGHISGNTQLILEKTKEAITKHQADVVLFPELVLVGYPPEDLLYRPALYQSVQQALETIQKAALQTTIILGYPRMENDTAYNSAAIIQNGQMIGSYDKQKLPNHTVFDEKRYFQKGHQPTLITIKQLTIGILICEDIWTDEPMADSITAGAQVILSLNASPYCLGQPETRQALLTQHSQQHHCPMVYVNIVGAQDEMVFDGGSAAYNAAGTCCQQAPFFEEAIMLTNIDTATADIPTPPITPPTLSIEEQVYRALCLGLQDYLQKNNISGVYLGVSGGIDSAVTLAIAVDALGPEAVTAVLMPSRYTANDSIDDAMVLIRNLKVEHMTYNIDDVYAAYCETLKPLLNIDDVDLTAQNIQARIRGMLLMALSNKSRDIVITTSNRSEMAMGYATLYGDMAGGFAVLKNVPKTMVYDLAHYRNKQSAVIPLRIINKAPSAELAPNQRDDDTLPPYDILDQILSLYIDEHKDPDDIRRAGFEPEHISQVVSTVARHEHKRRQAPIGIRLSETSFGRDRRYPITSGYHQTDKN